MDRFEYVLLIARTNVRTPPGVIWYRAPDFEQSLGDDLPGILNNLGAEGYELVAVGDVGYDGRSDLILKRRRG